MKKRLACLLLSTLFLTSCEKAVFKQFDDRLEDNRWMQNDVHHYDFEIAEAGKYDLYLDFSHIYDFQFPRVPVRVTIVTPDRKASIQHLDMELVDEGDVRSDCTGDVCDFRQEIFKGKQLEKGRYKVSVANEFDHEYLPNVIGVGIVLKKSGDN
jgi:gliding motility-associated lipoprotein GldH